MNTFNHRALNLSKAPAQISRIMDTRMMGQENKIEIEKFFMEGCRNGFKIQGLVVKLEWKNY